MVTEKSRIYARLPGKEADVPAFFYEMNSSIGLLVLKVAPKPDRRIERVTLGFDATVPDDLRLAGIGREDALKRMKISITSREGRGGTKWDTDQPGMEKSMIGAPVYDDGGRVVGVAKLEQNEDGETVVVVPIDVAGSLLGWIRLRELAGEAN